MEITLTRKERLEQQLDYKLEAYKKMLEFMCNEMLKDNPERQMLLETAFEIVFKLHQTRIQEKLELNTAANVVYDISNDFHESIAKEITDKDVPPKYDSVTEKSEKPLDNNQAAVSGEVDMESNKEQKLSPKIDLVVESDEAQLQGDVLLTQGEFENALTEYIRAIELNPNSASALYKRALAYSLLNMNDLCLIDCNRVIQLNPQYREVYGLLGMAYVRLGMFPQAQQAYAQALMFEPNNTLYKNTYQSLNMKLYQIELEKAASVPELRYLADRYEEFKKDDDIIAAAILLLHEPSASNITSIMLQNDRSEQHSNVINTFRYLLQQNEGIYIPLYKLPLEHQIEMYDKKEQKNKKKDTNGKQKLHK